MSQDIASQLYREFYRDNGAANTAEASAHWKAFAKNFKVELDSEGSIKFIQGYGFGGSEDNRLPAKIMAAIGNATIASTLQSPRLSESIAKDKKIVRAMGLSFSQDAFRQACTKYFLEKKMQENHIPVKNILVIGDGHGILSALLSEKYPGANIFLVDLGVTLFFQAYYLQKTFPAKYHTFLQGKDAINTSGFFYCAAEHLENLPLLEIDLAINVASMQEMTMAVVSNYFRLLRENKTKIFYCCNRLEKELPDGTVIRFHDYPWKKADIHLVEEKCPWHQFFAGRSAAPNLKLFGVIPVPFLHRYDGVHWHRLTLLSHQV